MASIDERAATLAESWINGNRSDVAEALEGAGVDGAALALALAREMSLVAGDSYSRELAAYMRRRAEQRVNDATHTGAQGGKVAP